MQYNLEENIRPNRNVTTARHFDIRAAMGDFGVAFHLCFKASPIVKLFIWKLVLFTCQWSKICMWIKLISIRTWTRFETEVKGNWEISYFIIRISVATALFIFYQTDTPRVMDALRKAEDFLEQSMAHKSKVCDHEIYVEGFHWDIVQHFRKTDRSFV